jgi:DNA-binding MarR family transcriptional regulator
MRAKRPKRNVNEAPYPGSEPDDLPETLGFMQVLWSLDHGLRSSSRRMERNLALTGPQRLVLRLVGRASGAAPSEIADLLRLDRGTMTGIVDRLASRGLLTRRVHPHDRRRQMLVLTARGRRIERRKSGTVEYAVRRALASLPRAKVAAAREVLDRIARALAPDANAR